MKKAEKIYLLCCVGLLILCIVLYKTMLDFFLAYNKNLNVLIALVFAVLAIVYLNVFGGLHGGVERFWGSFVTLGVVGSLVGGLFQGIEWIIEHVKIIP